MPSMITAGPLECAMVPKAMTVSPSPSRTAVSAPALERLAGEVTVEDGSPPIALPADTDELTLVLARAAEDGLRLVRMARRAGTRQTRLLKSTLGRLTDSLQAVKPLKAMARETLFGPMLAKPAAE